ncbi:adenylate/guanylate cyclase [Desulfocucumis palustris]|uniref:Adenylate/guanylate cyclase n=1 Tax=Desulfocucumis palustris TaxID=1898651 RepID=A0A2L2XGE3_9FIRM|nr:PAS domain S-box protein [Desulfocucumis palustris]GBF35308.1 adenylate/guanylate cyclase [Desulfocucumis palustris]
MSAIQFEKIFYSSPLPIFILYGDRFQLVNAKMAEITGYTVDQLLHMPFFNLVHSGDRLLVRENARRRLAGEEAPERYEFRAVDREGKVIYLTGVFSTVDFNGRVSILGQMLVVTEQKLAEQALRESELKYRSILENIVDGYFEVDIKGKLLFFNDSLCELTGCGKEELMGKSYLNFTTPTDIEKVFQAYNRVYTTGEPAGVFDWEIIRKDDGSIRFVEASVSLIIDNEGKRTGFRGVVRDVTERKRAEERFRLQKAYFQNLFENSPEGIAILDNEDRLINVNRSFEELFLYRADEVKGQLINHIIVPEEFENEAWDMTNATLLGKVVRKESVRKRKDGSLVDVSIMGFPMEINGKRLGVYGIYIDITQRKRSEEALNKALEKLTELENIINKSPVVVFLWVADMEKVWPVEYVSENISRYGYSPEDFTTGKTSYSSAIHPDDLKRVQAEVQQHYIMNNDEFTLEYRLVTKSGNFRWIEDRSGARRDACGVITHYQGIVTDITGRKEAETALKTANEELEVTIEELVATEEELTQRFHELQDNERALRESEEKYRILFHNVNDGIVMLEFENEIPSRIIEVNQVLCSRYGYTREELLAADPLQMVSAEHIHRIPVIVQKCRALGHVTFEIVLIAKKGREVPFEVSAHIYNMGDKVVGLLVIRDITDRKQSEEKLKYLSLHDSLTGLFNRAYFEQEMERLEGDRHSPVSIIICDVDGLKLVNDTMGHHKGDELLKTASSIIRESFRSGDVVARIGGDEFAVLLPRSGPGVVERAIQRLRDELAGYNEQNPDLLLSISIGFATGKGEKVNMGDLFKEADNNMYREKLHRSQSARSAIVQTLMRALEARDFITEGHADRLQELVAGVAQALGLPERNVIDLRLLAQFHDIGKVGIPDRILFKPGPLNSDEMVEMKRHCEIGHRIAQSSPDLVPIAGWILAHHEWWNGQGYPLGSREEEIPLECRILAIADAYDAMTSDRPYRRAMTHSDAVTELEKCAGTQFDPRLVCIFVRVLDARATKFDSL